MRAARQALLLLSGSSAAVVCLCCGAGVSTDPLLDSPLPGAGGGPGAGEAVSGAGGGNGAQPLPQLLARGAPCSAQHECGSGACLEDVEGTSRCCEADCTALGRECSTAGDCVCASRYAEVGGECLLRNGEACRDGADCASNACADSVCCDDACDGVCERCDAPEQRGICVPYTEDPACLGREGFACFGRDRCRLPAALTCHLDDDCDSDHCEPGWNEAPICCETACSGICQRCGQTGACDDFPLTDSACPLVTTCPPDTACVAYEPPEPRACAANGECAACTARHARAGSACGIGAQCDGAGRCVETGVGTVAAGAFHTCAIRENGNVRCWGSNLLGQLGSAFDLTHVGDDEEPSVVADLEIDFSRDVVQISAGYAHTCVLFAESGDVRCWGRVVDDSVFGTVPGLLGTVDVELDASGFVDPLETGDVSLPEAAVQISAAANGAHTCAVLLSGNVACWGYNGDGQCGNGTRDNVGGLSNEPLQVIELDPDDPSARALQVSAGRGHTCALLAGADGRVTCWGQGTFGRLGYGGVTPRLAPLGSVAVGEPAYQVAAGESHTCVLLSRGRVRCWGNNDNGQLGYGHPEVIGDDETPEEAAAQPGAGGRTLLGGDAPVGGGEIVQITAIATAGATCARFRTGAVRCWGENDSGQLGYGHTESLGTDWTPDELSRRPAGPGASRFAGGDVLPDAFTIALADGGRCALTRDGAGSRALYCWGENDHSQLGLPEFFPSASQNSTPAEMGAVNWE